MKNELVQIRTKDNYKMTTLKITVIATNVTWTTTLPDLLAKSVLETYDKEIYKIEAVNGKVELKKMIENLKLKKTYTLVQVRVESNLQAEAKAAAKEEGLSQTKLVEYLFKYYLRTLRGK